MAAKDTTDFSVKDVFDAMRGLEFFQGIQKKPGGERLALFSPSANALENGFEIKPEHMSAGLVTPTIPKTQMQLNADILALAWDPHATPAFKHMQTDHWQRGINGITAPVPFSR